MWNIQEYSIEITNEDVENILKFCDEHKGIVTNNVGCYRSVPVNPKRVPWLYNITERVKSAIDCKDFGNPWFVVHKAGDSFKWHNHSNCEQVCVTYIQSDGGDIEFRKDGEHYKITPKTGMVIMFPGELEHQVLPHNSDTLRISMAVNLPQNRTSS